jgi:hypothetical protein
MDLASLFRQRITDREREILLSRLLRYKIYSLALRIELSHLANTVFCL